MWSPDFKCGTRFGDVSSVLDMWLPLFYINPYPVGAATWGRPYDSNPRILQRI